MNKTEKLVKVETEHVICNECKRSFARNADLRKHVKHFHPAKLDELAPLKQRCFSFSCNYCNKQFNHKKNLNSHLKIHVPHASDNTPNPQKQKLNKKCPLCEYECSFRKDFYVHFKNIHDINITQEIIHLAKADFDNWKSKFEKETKSKFVLERGSTKSLVKYRCHRSGCFKPKGKGIRHIKTQGSNKVNGFCPAEIKAVFSQGEELTIYLTKTHVGHQCELGHLSLTLQERQTLATKIASKIPFNVILDEIRDSITTAPMERLHLLTRKDLNNIESCFNLQSSAVRHKNDAISVDSWVKEMENCVLLYKPQGIIMDEYSQLKEDDFVLVIMNEGQKAVYQQFSEKCVCVDGTHGLNNYNFELHTILVLDDLHQGFPCAFCISNRSDVDVMTLFFSCIQKETGCSRTTVFMSDIAEAYYNAWLRVMGPSTFRLYCTWHVDRAWRKNLSLIKTREKQKLVYHMIRTLLQETDILAFNKMLVQFIDQTANDVDTNAFAMYFENHYISKVSSWAYCYRLHCKINTNMHIERMHRTIKYIYCHGKKVKRLDKAISSIMKFVRDKLFDRLIVLNKGKVSFKLQELRKRHKSSISLKNALITKAGDHWEIPSSKTYEIYKIFENLTRYCECQLVCLECNSCIHQYSCTCLDSAIKWNMCKHIHSLCIWRRQHEDSILSQSDTDKGLEIHIDARAIESNNIFENIKNAPSTSNKKSINDKKKAILENITSILKNIDSDDELEAVERLLNPIQPTLAAIKASKNKKSDFCEGVTTTSINATPHNKKIETQKRFLSTKKKTNKKKVLSKPDNEEKIRIGLNLLQGRPHNDLQSNLNPT